MTLSLYSLLPLFVSDNYAKNKSPANIINPIQNSQASYVANLLSLLPRDYSVIFFIYCFVLMDNVMLNMHYPLKNSNTNDWNYIMQFTLICKKYYKCISAQLNIIVFMHKNIIKH